MERNLKRKHPVLHVAFKTVLILLLSVIMILVLIVSLWNGLKYLVYRDYYAVSKVLRNNPGLNHGYVTQGNCYYEKDDIFLTSGYMTNKNLASRIYSVNKDNKTFFTSVYEDENTLCNLHFGGMTYHDNYFFVASDSKLIALNKDDVLNKEKSIIQYRIDVNNQASFVFSDDNYFYVGEFNDSKQYKTNNHEKINDSLTYHAIISKYDAKSIKEGATPVLKEIYHIRDQVQGVCITDSSRIVLSTSWGLSPSKFYVYNAPTKVARTDENNIPHYYLDDSLLADVIEGPSMAEDLDYHDGRVITSSESASNKYIFGKLFFYNKIEGLLIG